MYFILVTEVNSSITKSFSTARELAGGPHTVQCLCSHFHHLSERLVIFTSFLTLCSLSLQVYTSSFSIHRNTKNRTIFYTYTVSPNMSWSMISNLLLQTGISNFFRDLRTTPLLILRFD